MKKSPAEFTKLHIFFDGPLFHAILFAVIPFTIAVFRLSSYRYSLIPGPNPGDPDEWIAVHGAASLANWFLLIFWTPLFAIIGIIIYAVRKRIEKRKLEQKTTAAS